MSGAPVVDYTATSARPPWSALPSSLRTALAVALGTEIVEAGPSVGSGFTGGFAAPLKLADGREVFVKATDDTLHSYRAYQREAEVVPQLPTTIHVPRIVATAHASAPIATTAPSAPRETAPIAPQAPESSAPRGTSEGEVRWFAVVSERIAGRMPGLPWTAEDFATVTATCELMAAALTPSPFAGLRPFTDSIAASDFPDQLPAEILTGQRALPDGFQPWLGDRLREIQDLVDLYPVTLAGTSAMHTDLRPDNLLLDSANTCWTVDWNWLSLGPSWFDWFCLLPLAHRDGIDTAAAIKASPLTAGVPAEHLDSVAAIIGTYMLNKLDAPPPLGCTIELRRHQRLYAWAFLDWLAIRRDWA
ncbi:phosphotransferase [Kribbella catacumbae]|uniref:phosphotransferase n=1 Tax=Kribbella catacumbae TaxID=460086 RepID=UPI00035C4C8B|nr:phosphotransferase [Kribbella catacumbae]